ncbi:uncharacterized protein LOC132565060 [Ylistrum balloti]|uniref:uncharacterized protein LOC132565060 n=1 Tax=Ylistrum balloti TaxID=509963 RepID=UPI002905EEFF|nr:uncharacterized protein LOC132565060 [Ylistrum balloti]
MDGMTRCLFVIDFAISISHNLQASDSDVCAIPQPMPSAEYTRFLGLDETQCILKAENVEDLTPICKSTSGQIFWKLACLCAGILPHSYQCEDNYTKHCCHENVACFNGGKLEESNCSANHVPTYKCKCPSVVDRGPEYQGDRCQNILGIRECHHLPNGNWSYNRCSDEKDTNAPCSHNNDTSYICGPARQNNEGKDFKECKRREDITVNTPAQLTDNTGNSKLIIGVTIPIVFVVGVVVGAFCFRRRLRRKSMQQRRIDHLDEQDTGNVIEEDDLHMVESSPPEQRPFLRRSVSMPANW